MEIELIPGSFQHHLSYKELWPKHANYKIKVIEVWREKSKETIGFSVQVGNGWDRQDGFFVSRILIGSVYDMCGLLSIGEEIVKIDDTDVADMNVSQAVGYFFDNPHFKIYVKVRIPFAKQRIATRGHDYTSSAKEGKHNIDFKIMNMRIGPPRAGRHVYEEPPPEEVEEGGEEQVEEGGMEEIGE